jgi:hypothetical protein
MGRKWRGQKAATIRAKSLRDSEIAARIIGVRIAPLLHQGLEFGVVAVR